MTAERSKEDILRQINEKAKEYMSLSANCAQSSFLALSDQFELGGGAVMKALSPLTGGIALQGETCGAVIGSLAALGIVYGSDKLGDWGAFFNALFPSIALCQAFKKEFGGTLCSEVLSSLFGKTFNLSDQAEFAEWRKVGGMEKCSVVVGKSCLIAAELIIDKV